MDTPNYIKALLTPNGKKPQGRKVWSIDLELIWLPFFFATNTQGETAIPHDALGAPLRLAYDGDGSVRFSKSGRPIMKVAKELSDSIRMVRENFTAGLQHYAGEVINANLEGYKAQVEASKIAGEPIVSKDRHSVEEALRKAVEDTMREAEAKAEAEVAPEPEAKAEPKGKSKAKAREPELVTA
jgi:hypothetical protein